MWHMKATVEAAHVTENNARDMVSGLEKPHTAMELNHHVTHLHESSPRMRAEPVGQAVNGETALKLSGNVVQNHQPDLLVTSNC